MASLLGFRWNRHLHRLEVLREGIQTAIPETPVLLEPRRKGLQWLPLEMTRPPLRLPATRDEAGGLQHLEVLRDGGDAHVVGLRELLHVRVARGEPSEDASPCRIGESE